MLLCLGGDVWPASSNPPEGERAEVSGMGPNGPEGPGGGRRRSSRRESQGGAGWLQDGTTGRADSLVPSETESRWTEQRGGPGRGSTVADQIQIWVLHMGNHSPTKAESLQAERYFRFTRSSAGLSCHRSIDSLLTTHLRHRQGDKSEQWLAGTTLWPSRIKATQGWDLPLFVYTGFGGLKLPSSFPIQGIEKYWFRSEQREALIKYPKSRFKSSFKCLDWSKALAVYEKHPLVPNVLN